MVIMAFGQEFALMRIKRTTKKSRCQKQRTLMKSNRGNENEPRYQTQTMANGLSQHSQGQRPWDVNRDQSIWPTAIFNA
jgi:hypothetical protein